MQAPDRSGGLRWHLRAFLRHRTIWKPFREAVSRFLASWQPPTRTLILVGPSAGWCLPSEFPARFDRVIAVDPDRWAPFLFRRRHPDVPVQWIAADFFAGASALLKAEPEATILFCNMLGQLRFTGLPEDQQAACLRGISDLLAGHAWASIHEILSSETSAQPHGLSLQGALPGEEVLVQMGLGGAWLDHLAAPILPATVAREIVPWRFAPGRLHLVEMGIGGEAGRLTARPS